MNFPNSMNSSTQNGAIFGLGKIHYNVYTSLITLFFNIVLISISIYFFGLMGAAYASVLGGLVYILSSRYFFRKAKFLQIIDFKFSIQLFEVN